MLMQPRPNADKPKHKPNHNNNGQPPKKFKARQEAQEPRHAPERVAVPNTEGRKLKIMGLHPDVANGELNVRVGRLRNCFRSRALWRCAGSTRTTSGGR